MIVIPVYNTTMIDSIMAKQSYYPFIPSIAGRYKKIYSIKSTKTGISFIIKVLFLLPTLKKTIIVPFAFYKNLTAFQGF